MNSKQFASITTPIKGDVRTSKKPMGSVRVERKTRKEMCPAAKDEDEDKDDDGNDQSPVAVVIIIT